MIILVRVHNVRGRCRIPGYNDGTWFEVDTLKYSIKNEHPGSTEESEARPVTFEKVEIEKEVDTASCSLMFQGCKGAMIASVEVHMVETAKNGTSNFPFLMLRFERVYLSKWELNLKTGDAGEKVEFDYEKVAIEYHSTKDGCTYDKDDSKGWDISNYGAANAVKGTSWTYFFSLRGDSA